MGFEPMNNGFAGRRVSHFATRAHIGSRLIAAQKHKTHCAWQWVRLKLKTGRLSPDARTNACATATHAGATAVHLDQRAHGFIHYTNCMLRASGSFIEYEN